MSGHSKWHSIKHKKAAVDAKRGSMFTRLIKEITVAARTGGGDVNSNARLRAAVATAKAANMPAENIVRAVQRGTGELPGVRYEDVVYEGYGPGGVAMYIEAVTDNKNRMVAELRHLFSRFGGNLGETGCVSWMFEKKGYFVVEKGSASEEALLEIVLDAGADDLREDDGNFEILCAPGNYEKVKEKLEERGLKPEVAQISMIPQNYVDLTGKAAQQMLKLAEALDEHDDVQHVWANFNVDEEALKAVS
ncbi:MAG: YebC/PmpR family DNA-binding transcriptional regulator [Acidobacteria bacterium]|nr:YebC/PmpR family DNA-binding transcriptional regulator [Acidobacteriota bacterium]